MLFIEKTINIEVYIFYLTSERVFLKMISLQVHNYLVEFLNEISLLTKGTETVIWVGLHPWITTIYQFLEENGIKNFAVVDNNIEIQGKEIWTYEKTFTENGVPFNKINIGSVKKYDDNAIYYS